jgi:energy-coupling factor transporter transmembrane protein EcfT
MEENPYIDGKIRGHTDAIVRAIVIGAAIVVAWNVPYSWYWRVAIFLGIMFVLGIIYPAVQLAWSRRRQKET